MAIFVAASATRWRKKSKNGVDVLLRGGPGDGQVVPGGGETVVWQAYLYEITSDYGRRHGRGLRIYRHRPDRCEPYVRGAEDRCE